MVESAILVFLSGKLLARKKNPYSFIKCSSPIPMLGDSNFFLCTVVLTLFVTACCCGSTSWHGMARCGAAWCGVWCSVTARCGAAWCSVVCRVWCSVTVWCGVWCSVTVRCGAACMYMLTELRHAFMLQFNI